MPKTFHTLGIMSGSSLDALDIVSCQFTLNGNRREELLVQWDMDWATEIPIPDALKTSLQQWQTKSIEELWALDIAFCRWAGSEIKNALADKLEAIDFISSHGHTLIHRPEKGFSWQIGDGSTLAAVTGKPVVYNFRMKDIAFGGQGAPMVAIAEAFLWPDYHAFLNLGGIANVSLHQGDNVLAWDVSACNQLLNALSAQCLLPYDRNGHLASTGVLLDDLYQKLLQSQYHKKHWPKSLDNGTVQAQFTDTVLQHSGSIPDKLHTCCHYIAQALANDLRQHLLPQKIVLSGGGALNGYLVECIEAAISPLSMEVVLPDEATIRYKEAIMIAFCGVLRWNGIPNFYATATGASQDAVGGVIAL
jgi:anhydro-N-acetylmuramic acid kinase